MEVDKKDEGNDLLNRVAENTSLPQYILERMKKLESGPPNGWRSEPPPRNMRTPARNILRT